MEHADPNPDHHDFAAERAELVDWLLTQGFTAEQIDESFAPMLLPARRALGDDGVLLSARQISARTGLDLPVFASLQDFLEQPQQRLGITVGALARGFHWVEQGLDLVTETELFASQSGARRRKTALMRACSSRGENGLVR